MIITVTNWDKWQQTKGNWSRSSWFKLHREMRGNPDWRRLSDGAARLLVDLLMSTDHGNGTVDMTLEDLAFTLALELEDLEAWLAELVERNWLTLARGRARSHAGGRATRGEENKNTRERTPSPKGGSAPASTKLAPAARGKGDKHGPDLGPQRLVADPDTVH